MSNITKKNVIEKVSIRTGLTQIDTKIVVDCFLEALTDSLRQHHPVELRGFGRFKVREVKPREVYNPQSQKRIKVDGGFKPVFEPAKLLRERVDGGA